MSVIESSILLVSGPFSVRGSCAYSLRLAERLPGAGFRCSVVCPDARIVDPERRRELQIREVAHVQMPLWGQVVMRLMHRLLKQDPPDLIHIQSRAATRQGIWLARRFRCPYVQTVHDYLRPRESLVVDRRWCRRIIAVSESVKLDLLQRTGLPAELISVIHSGVDTCDAYNASTVLREGRVPVVGAAGPLEAVKGFPFFLGAAARVLAAGRDVEFMIAGAGPEESNLRRLAHELKIDHRVTFVPKLVEYDEALSAMDIFCLPSLQQGIGTIMLQAMSIGRPVIATRVGGVHFVVKHNETGLLVPPGNSELLAQSILTLLDDPTRARAMGHAAREKVIQDFSVNQMVSQTAELYQAVLAAESVESASKAVVA